MKLLEDVYLVGGGGYGLTPVGNWCNVYLIDGGKKSALIDAGSGIGTTKILENILEEGFDPMNIEYLLLTHFHFDHIGGAHEIKRITNCKTAIHEYESDKLESLSQETLVEYSPISIVPPKVDIKLRGGEKFKVGKHTLEIIHTPGHTLGSVCILMRNNGKKILFSGDTVFARGRIGWFNTPTCNIEKYKESLKKLLELKPDVLLPGHGTFILSDATHHIRLLLNKLDVPWKCIITTLD